MTSPPVVPAIDRREFGLRFLHLAAALALPSRRASASPATADAYDVVVQRDVMVAMRDGVRLATDLYFRRAAIDPSSPACRRSSSAHRMENRRRRRDMRASRLPTRARRGYVVAYQDVRGRGGSEGWEHGRFDASWRQLGIYGSGFYDEYCDAAILLMSSWYEPYPRTTTGNFVGVTRPFQATSPRLTSTYGHGGDRGAPVDRHASRPAQLLLPVIT